MLKRILFRTNVRPNSSAEYSAETDVAKLAHNSAISEYSVFGRIFGNLAEYSVFCRIFSQNCLIIYQKCQVFYKKSYLFPLIAKIFGQLSQIFGKILNIWPKYRIFGQKPNIWPNTECCPNVRIRPNIRIILMAEYSYSAETESPVSFEHCPCSLVWLIYQVRFSFAIQKGAVNQQIRCLFTAPFSINKN